MIRGVADTDQAREGARNAGRQLHEQVLRRLALRGGARCPESAQPRFYLRYALDDLVLVDARGARAVVVRQLRDVTRDQLEAEVEIEEWRAEDFAEMLARRCAVGVVVVCGSTDGRDGRLVCGEEYLDA